MTPEDSKSDVNKTTLRNKLIKYGAIAGVLGTLLAAIQPWAMEKAIVSQSRISESGPAFKIWQRLPFPLMSSYYIFNVTNPDEFVRGSRIKVREIGPFVMEQWRYKEVIDWDDKTVKYHEWKDYKERDDLSAFSWDQELVVVNPIVATLGTLIRDRMSAIIPVPMALSPFVYGLTSVLLILHSESIFIRTTPRKILMGYKVNLLNTAEAMLKPLAFTGLKPENIIPMEDLPNNSFGILNGKNHTPIGPWQVYTGHNVPKHLFTSAVSFKNQRILNKWASPGSCNLVQGTDGVQFQPFIDQSDNLTVFAADLCRKLKLTFDKEDEFRGISALKYKIAEEEWQPPTHNPENACYCVHKTRPDRCAYYGIMDVAGCFGGSPFVITLPHFLRVDPYIADRVEGLDPQTDKHEFYLKIKQDLGLPIEAKVRLQFNVRIEQTPFLRGFSNLKDTIIPLIWFEDSAELDDFFTYLVKYGLVYGAKTASISFFAAAITGWSCVLLGIGYFFIKKPNNLVFEPPTTAKTNSKSFYPKLLGSVSNTSGSFAKNSRIRPLGDYSSNLEIYRNQVYPYSNYYFTSLNTDPLLHFYNLYPAFQSHQHSHLLLAIPVYKGDGESRRESIHLIPSSVRAVSDRIQTSKDALQQSNKVSRAVSARDRAIQIDPDLISGGFKYVEPNDLLQSRWNKLQMMSPAGRNSRQPSTSSDEWNSGEEEDTKETARSQSDQTSSPSSSTSRSLVVEEVGTQINNDEAEIYTDLGVKAGNSDSDTNHGHLIAETVVITPYSALTKPASSSSQRQTTSSNVYSISREEGIADKVNMPDRRPFRRPSGKITSTPSCIIS